MESSRFPELSEDDLIKLLNSKDSTNTKKANKQAVSIFEAFLSSKLNFRHLAYGKWTELSASQLSPVLRKFYAEARTQKGDFYKKSTMLSLRNSLNRHVNNIKRERGRFSSG